MVINEFIDTCKLKLRDGIVETNLIEGVVTRCTVFEDEKLEIIKSMSDYSMVIIKKDTHKSVICLDKEGYVSKIDREWKILAESM
jgi:hypothetical protein